MQAATRTVPAHNNPLAPPAYVGRFAPSPTGLLHAGSLVAALGSWLDARAHNGQWLLRIEDIDGPRCQSGAAQAIVQQLAHCGMVSDLPVLYQSQRHSAYAAALQRLRDHGQVYGCACSRKTIEAAWQAQGKPSARFEDLIYPGTCRAGTQGQPVRAWRMRVDDANSAVQWSDRRLGPQSQNVATQVGDFVLLRADGIYAYQLAVVVDDAEQGVTDIVRGADLADNTARQLLLQRALGFAQPRYLHLPLVCAPDGAKLSKQNGAVPVDTNHPLAALQSAAATLGLAPSNANSTAEALAAWVAQWRDLYNRSP